MPLTLFSTLQKKRILAGNFCRPTNASEINTWSSPNTFTANTRFSIITGTDLPRWCKHTRMMGPFAPAETDDIAETVTLDRRA
jgi:hypothetical protein